MVLGIRFKKFKESKKYIGSTKFLPKERLNQHNSGSNTWTKSNGPFELIYRGKYATVTEARKRENFFKIGVGRKFLNQMLKDLE